MPATETLAPPQPAAEQQIAPEEHSGRERLTHEQMRREFAAVALLAILMATYGERDHDDIFAHMAETAESTQPDQPELAVDNPDNGDVFMGLINNAYTDNEKKKLDDLLPHNHVSLTGDLKRYRSRFYGEGTAAPEPDFRPAPSMSATPLGPQMPNLAFNDRIRADAAIKNPSAGDFAAANHANDLYQRALVKNGWQGGEASSEQHAKASREVIRQTHPDRPENSAADAEAFKIFNASNSEKTATAKAAAAEASAASDATNAPSGGEAGPGSSSTAGTGNGEAGGGSAGGSSASGGGGES